jgi:hypothetical protein
VRRIWGSLIDTFNTFSPCEKPLAKINHLIFKHIKEKHPKSTTPDEILWSHQGIQLRCPIPILEERTPTFKCGTFVIHDEQIVCNKEHDRLLVNGKKHLVKGESLKEGNVLCFKNDKGTFETSFTVGKKGMIMPFTKEKCVFSEEILEQAKVHLRKLFFFVDTPIKVIEFLEPFKEGFVFSPYFSIYSSHDEIEERLNTVLDTWQKIMISFQEDKILASVLNYFKLECEEMKYTDVQKALRLFQFVYFALKEPSEEFEDLVSDYTYYLGEFLRFGYGKCFHVALLFKVLADQLGLKARIEAGYIPEAHAWNVVEIKGEYYFADGARGGFFPLKKDLLVK